MAGAAAVLVVVLVVGRLGRRRLDRAGLAGAAWPARELPADSPPPRPLPRRAPPCGGCAAPAPGRSRRDPSRALGPAGGRAARLRGRLGGRRRGVPGLRLLAAQILEQGAAPGGRRRGFLPARLVVRRLLVVLVEEIGVPPRGSSPPARRRTAACCGPAAPGHCGRCSRDRSRRRRRRRRGGRSAGSRRRRRPDGWSGRSRSTGLVRFSHVGSGSHGTSFFDEGLEEFDRERKHDRRVLLGRDLRQRLQVAQLQGRRLPEMISAASESFAEAWSSPSAWMIFARFSRSASACLAIARCMSGGRSTCLTSTARP